MIEQLRTQSFQSQIEYLELVFSLIDTNDEEQVQKFLQWNEQCSYEWCRRFKVPIASRFPLVEESRNDLPASAQQ